MAGYYLLDAYYLLLLAVCLGQVLALRAHCVGTACILRTQRLGYSSK